ncbi:MAG: aldehyde dehydrogenase family protein [Sandaracinus sp.]|nr:aldehyde dehydrogenase family protein [Sandaracinus sp.]MCB9631461.1 aldehyde dehydrogenase family protein [Sandaracinus sp.]
MTDVQKTVSPIDGQVIAEHPLASASEADAVLGRAQKAFEGWRRTSLEERTKRVGAFVDALVAKKSTLADELTSQMGRPRRYTEGELGGFEDRARTMMRLAPEALADVDPGDKAGFVRRLHREPLGVVLVLSPWNYPWLTAVNAVVPALLSGNVVLLKHSDQTPLVADRMSEAAKEAGLPEGVFSHVHASHDRVAEMVRDSRVAYVAFTGSVEGGHAVVKAASERFVGLGLELGGKDPAYVAADAPFDFAVENVVDGAFFNSGQSCCAVERVYVHASIWERFVEAFVALTKQYVLGDPREQATTLGPVVRARNAQGIQAQIDAAIAAGAKSLIDPKSFAGAERGLPYLAPQVLVDVTHDMAFMRDETFGPAIGLMKVQSDEEALRLMNDSRYGLTASIWTSDLQRAETLGAALETGTVFMNRCDYLDPELAWVGVKDSGRGCTLSRWGFESLTRPKSFHLRLPPG